MSKVKKKVSIRKEAIISKLRKIKSGFEFVLLAVLVTLCLGFIMQLHYNAKLKEIHAHNYGQIVIERLRVSSCFDK